MFSLRRVLPVAIMALASVPSFAQVRISQIYGGGGNSGATLRNDFVELFNAGSSPVSLTGHCLQYASAAGTFTLGNNQNVNLSGSIAAGGYYLVQLAQGTGGTTNLPTPDVSALTAVSATAGKFALLNSCGTALASGEGVSGGRILDFVGFGTTANQFEGAGPTPAPSNTNAVLRGANGCTDNNINSTDFAAGTPNPRNSATAANPCTGPLTILTSSLPAATVGVQYSQQLLASGGTGNISWSLAPGSSLPANLTLSGSGLLAGVPATTVGSPFSFTVRITDASLTPVDKLLQLTVNAAPTCTVTHSISAIQGSGSTSPVAGNAVTTSGIVTARRSNGFYMQDPAGDGNAATSDGLFVFTSSTPSASAAVGNNVCVTGTVTEFAPTTAPNGPYVTEIGVPTALLVLSTGNTLPAPVVLSAANTNPAGGLDVLERFEGMRVQIASLTVVAPTDGNLSEANATASSTGQFYGVITGIARPFREPGIQLPDALPAGAPNTVPRFDANPERILVDSTGQTGNTAVDVAAGQTISNLTGVLDFRSSTYTVVRDAGSLTISAAPTATAVPAPATSEFTVASFNMERFYDSADDVGGDAVLTATAFNNRLNKASLTIRNVLRTPDIIGVQEVENLNALQALAEKIRTDVGSANPVYQPFIVSGNDVGLINVGFLVKTTVTVDSVTQFGKTETFTNPLNNQQETLNDRPPLVLQGSVNGVPIVVVVNHLRSLNSIDDATEGPRVRAKRKAQAEYLANLLQSLQSASATRNVISIGDYNAFQFNDGFVDSIGTIRGVPTPANLVTTASPDLVNPDLLLLSDKLAAADRYSYVFEGNAQILDHAIVSAPLAARVSRFTYARVNADYPETVRNDSTRPERLSDHDPLVAYISTSPLPPDITSSFSITRSALALNRVTRLYTGSITLTNSSSSTINGPLQLALLNLPAGVTLSNASGNLPGGPFVFTPNVTLAPGQSVTVSLSFSNPGNIAVTYTPAVFVPAI